MYSVRCTLRVDATNGQSGAAERRRAPFVQRALNLEWTKKEDFGSGVRKAHEGNRVHCWNAFIIQFMGDKRMAQGR